MAAMRGFPELRSLDLSGCDSVAPTGLLPSLEQWTLLEHVNLESCSLLAHVQLSLPRLQGLQLQGCRSLVWVRFSLLNSLPACFRLPLLTCKRFAVNR